MVRVRRRRPARQGPRVGDRQRPVMPFPFQVDDGMHDSDFGSGTMHSGWRPADRTGSDSESEFVTGSECWRPPASRAMAVAASGSRSRLFSRQALRAGELSASGERPRLARPEGCLDARRYPLRCGSASQSWQPRAGSDGRTNPLRRRRPCTDSPSRVASHVLRRAEGTKSGPRPVERSRGGPISRSDDVLTSA